MTEVVLLGVIYLSSLADAPRILHAGPFTALGILSALICCSAWALWFVTPGVPNRLRDFAWSYIALLAWGWISLLWSASWNSGGQNLAVMAAFFGIAALCFKQTRTSDAFPSHLRQVLGRGMVIITVLYSAGLLSLWMGLHLVGASARGFALFTLLGLCHFLSSWRYGRRRSLLYAVVLTALIGMSLCRTAFFVALLLFPLAQRPSKGLREAARITFWLIIVIAAGWASLRYSETMQRRFFSGDLSMQVAGVSLNMSGRTAFWKTTLASSQEAMWFGKGAGSAERLMQEHFSEIGHPHSEYLRILHDYGTVGLVAFVYSITSVFLYLFRSWIRNDKRNPQIAETQLCGILALIAVSLTMITDNALVYIFIMSPMGLLLGAALGVTGKPLRFRGYSVITRCQ